MRTFTIVEPAAGIIETSYPSSNVLLTLNPSYIPDVSRSADTTVFPAFFFSNQAPTIGTHMHKCYVEIRAACAYSTCMYVQRQWPLSLYRRCQKQEASSQGAESLRDNNQMVDAHKDGYPTHFSDCFRFPLHIRSCHQMSRYMWVVGASIGVLGIDTRRGSGPPPT